MTLKRLYEEAKSDYKHLTINNDVTVFSDSGLVNIAKQDGGYIIIHDDHADKILLPIKNKIGL
jgi:hypothetical protein